MSAVIRSKMLNNDQVLAVFKIIADEIGVTEDNVYDTDDFSLFGLDDVLSKSITERIKEQLKLDLPSTLFQMNSSATDVRDYLKKQDENRIQDVGLPLPASRSGKPNNRKERTIKSRAPPLSITLQGHPSTAHKIIFLLPDGSGSAMVYSQFPQIAQSVCLVAFNSPFLTVHTPNNKGEDPISFKKTSIESLCLIWAEEIRRRQASGPYILGGYSAGGYYAFEVAKHLRRAGQVVEKLVLIDTPCRLEFGAPQMEAIDFLSERGMLGGQGTARKAPDWFLRHFRRTIEAVERYMPTSMAREEEKQANAKEMPECFVIWATQGVFDEIDVEPLEIRLDWSASITRFMLEGGKKLGSDLHGWDRILPDATIWEGQVPGNHFSLVHRPNCNAFQAIFRDLLQDVPDRRQYAWQLR